MSRRRVLRGFVPEELQRIREKKKWSRGDLARVTDVDTRTIGRWEDGETAPTIDLLARATAALGVPLSRVIVVPAGERDLTVLRWLRGLTQPELASRLRVTTSRLSDLERGEAPLSDQRAELLARELGVSKRRVLQAYELTRLRPPGTWPGETVAEDPGTAEVEWHRGG
ncbi:helix-turn-helix transcriptional regulator [Tsukamurella strandjordii]|uniref:helix-turn-helix transcriptional regulator n=1 Tax=Tsukamurella strandjordii TaxID=147577 RepID=UPI0031D75579